MKTVRLIGSKVVEIIPNYATPVEKWYGAVFAASCRDDAPDEVAQGWTYSDGVWSEQQTEAEPTLTDKERIDALESENKLLTQQVEALSGQMDFQEECIVEMAGIVYA